MGNINKNQNMNNSRPNPNALTVSASVPDINDVSELDRITKNNKQKPSSDAKNPKYATDVFDTIGNESKESSSFFHSLSEQYSHDESDQLKTPEEGFSDVVHSKPDSVSAKFDDRSKDKKNRKIPEDLLLPSLEDLSDIDSPIPKFRLVPRMRNRNSNAERNKSPTAKIVYCKGFSI